MKDIDEFRNKLVNLQYLVSCVVKDNCSLSDNFKFTNTDIINQTKELIKMYEED